MGRGKGRRASTLSISLPQGLADEVSDRVESGLYTSASELIREALRLLLRTEELQRAHLAGLADPAPEAARALGPSRFATTMELLELGAAMRESKIRGEATEADRAEVSSRIQKAMEEKEAGPGLRIAPERLARLKAR